MDQFQTNDIKPVPVIHLEVFLLVISFDILRIMFSLPEQFRSEMDTRGTVDC